MDSVSPDAACIAGDQQLASGAHTFFGNTSGKLTETKNWLVGSTDSRTQRHHQRQRPHGYGHPH